MSLRFGRVSIRKFYYELKKVCQGKKSSPLSKGGLSGGASPYLCAYQSLGCSE